MKHRTEGSESRKNQKSVEQVYQKKTNPGLDYGARFFIQSTDWRDTSDYSSPSRHLAPLLALSDLA